MFAVGCNIHTEETRSTSLADTLPDGAGCPSDAGTFPTPPPWNGGPDKVLFQQNGALPESLALASGAAFWSDPRANTITKLTLADGGVSPLVSGQSGQLVTDGVFVYFATSTDLRRVPVGGGTPSVLAPNLQLHDFTLHNDTLFGVGTHSGQFTPCAVKIADDTGAVTNLACNNDFVGPVAVDGTSLFAAGNSTIYSIPVAGGTPKPLVLGESASHLAAANGQLYWTVTQSTATVKTMPESGGCPTTLFSAPGSSGQLAVDDAKVYFTSNASGQLFAVPRDGGAASFVPQTQNAPPFAVQVRGDQLFWTQIALFQPLGQVTSARTPN
jgi:hypothetical protein